MAITQVEIDLAATILRLAGIVLFYMLIGVGPGIVVGFLLANLIWGKGHTLMDIQIEDQAEAAEHNKLFRPEHPRWQKN